MPSRISRRYARTLCSAAPTYCCFPPVYRAGLFEVCVMALSLFGVRPGFGFAGGPGGVLPQHSQQVVLDATRLRMDWSQLWPSAHTHQTTSFECGETSLGRRFPFFFLSHCLAVSGESVARQFVTDTCLPEQNGQPEPCPVRFAGVANHS